MGALLYLLAYGMYFGTNVVDNIQKYNGCNEWNNRYHTISKFVYVNNRVILPVAVMLDMLWDRERKENPKDKKQTGFIEMKNLIDKWMKEQTKTIIEIIKI